MADNNAEIIGGVAVTVEADLSDLQSGFDSAVATATRAGQDIASALTAASDTTSTDALTQSLQDVGNAAETAGSQMAALANEPQTLAEYYDELEAAALAASSATEQVGNTAASTASDLAEASSAAQEASTSHLDLAEVLQHLQESITELSSRIDELGESVKKAAQNAEEAKTGFAGLTEGLTQLAEALVVTEALKEFATEALSTYAAIQKAEISLTALTGSAEQATLTIESLKSLALENALSFPQLVAADQRMTAFGISTSQIPALLQDAANAAGATGNEFERVSQALIRMTASGMASSRMLVTLGITSDDLGRVMNETGADVAKAFKALDQSQRVEALNLALQKFQGIGEAVAKSLGGEWQNFQTKFEFVMEEVGKGLAPAAEAILSFANSVVIPAVQAMVEQFNELPGPVRTFIGILAGISAVAVPVILGIKGIVTAIEGLTAIKAAALAISASLSGTAVAAGEATAAEVANTEATAVNTGTVDTNTLAQRANAAALAARGVAAGEAAGATAAGTTAAVAGSTAWGTFAGIVSDLVWPALLVLAPAVWAVKENDELASGATESWTDALLHFLGIESQAEAAAEGLAKIAKETAADFDKASNAVNEAGDKLRALHPLWATTRTAISDASEAVEGHRAKLRGLSEDLEAAKIHLHAVQDAVNVGAKDSRDLADAYDQLEKATAALTAGTAKLSPEAKKLADYLKLVADNTAQWRINVLALPAPIATVSSETEIASAETKAHAEAISYSVAKLLELKTALVQAQAAYEAHLGPLEAVLKAEEKAAAEEAFLSKLIGKVPDVGPTFNPNPPRELAAAIGSVVETLPELQPFTQTLEQIDEEWAKQSRHVDQLAKYDLPAAIQAYQTHIDQLKQVEAANGEIYASQEKLLQIQIDYRSQFGADATAQIIALTNLKEKTEALQFASQGLGDVYAGLVHSFDDAFIEMGKQLTDVAIDVESLGQAMHNFVQKIAGEVVNVLVRYALGELKKAVVDVLGSLSSVGGGIGTLFGKLAGTITKGAGGASGVQMQAAVTQFQAAVTQFHAPVTQFQGIEVQFSGAIGRFQGTVSVFDSSVTTFGEGATTFDGATTFFDETTGIFDDATAVFDDATVFFDETTALFDDSTFFFDKSTISFGAAVTAFGTAVAGMGGGGFLGGLLKIFTAAGGGEVGNVPILSYLHPKELILPADISTGLKSIISSGSTNVGSLGNATININSGTLPNLSGFTEAVNGFTDAIASSSRSEAPASPVSTTPSVSVSVPQAPSPRIAVPSMQAPEASAPKSLAPRTEPEPSISSVTASAFRTSVGEFAEIAGSLGKLPVAVTNFKTTTDSFTDRLSDFGSKMGKAGATSTAESGTSFSSPGLSGAVGLRLYAFEGGGDVPGNVLALLHAQEMVLPAPLAQGLRNLFAQGGLGQSPKQNAPQDTAMPTQANATQAAPQTADAPKTPANPFVDFGTIMGSGINALIGSLTGHAPKNAVPDVTVSVPSNSLALPSVPSSASSFALPSTGESSVSGGSERAVFENCVFNGVTQTMVNEIMNKVVQATRRAGSRF